jgi:heme/copper-type cytochrome/quinol oxidase subunit 2
MTIMHGSSAAMNTKGWLITLVKALLISWVLLFLTTFFHVHFVREAGEHVQAASRD